MGWGVQGVKSMTDFAGLRNTCITATGKTKRKWILHFSEVETVLPLILYLQYYCKHV